MLRDFNLPAKKEHKSAWKSGPQVGGALAFASEAKIEIEAKILFRFEAKKKGMISHVTSKGNNKNLKRK